jgi:hypothetical protein
VADVVHAARRKIVEHVDVVAKREQLIAQVGTDEACPTGDEVLQAHTPFYPWPYPCRRIPANRESSEYRPRKLLDLQVLV